MIRGENEHQIIAVESSTITLTDIQLQFLRLVASGSTRGFIENELGLKKNSSTGFGVFEQLGVNNITSAVVEAIRRGFINLSDIRVQAITTDQQPVSELTPRQKEILILVGKGGSNEKIGETLGIATNTVHNGLSSSYERLGIVSSRVALVVRGLQLGIIKLEDI